MSARDDNRRLLLPTAQGQERYTVGAPIAWERPARSLTSRVTYAAAHVIPLLRSETTPGAAAQPDWDLTMAYRHEIWSYGLGVADGMDTAQRGMGLDWPATKELIRRSGIEARAVGGMLACGAGTDQLDVQSLGEGPSSLSKIVDAYREQIDVVLGAGAKVIIMASRALASVARSPEDYLSVYGQLLEAVDEPVILHWLGPMFDPALHGYWGSGAVADATDTFVSLIADHEKVVDGVKVSLLDASHEVDLRRRLPESVRLYTGDDYNYPELIVGDGSHHSDALLGIFAAIYPAASTALQALDAGDELRARAILESTQDLSRHLFAAPTQYYKTGIAFLSWLNGKQPGFTLVGGLHGGRSLLHLVEAFKLADRAGLLQDSELATRRLVQLMSVHGWEASA